jgi:hypothetical protein
MTELITALVESAGARRLIALKRRSPRDPVVVESGSRTAYGAAGLI